MVRGVYIQRAASERMSVEAAVRRYVVEVTPNKRPSTQVGERRRAGILISNLGHMFNVAIKEWGSGLTYNPVQSIRRPSPGPGRNRRLQRDEEARLLAAVDAHSNPMLGWIVRIALGTGMRSSEILTLQR